MSKATDVPFEETLRVRDSCLCLHVQRASRALARHYDETFRPLGLTSGQFSLMMSLNQPSPPTMGAVSRLLAMDRTTVTANLKPLERRGLVAVAVDPDDRRNRRLHLTPAGRQLLAEALPFWDKAQKEVQELAGEADLNRFCAELRALS